MSRTRRKLLTVMSNIQITILSSERLFPEYSTTVTPEKVPLSVLDASVANYSVTGGVWVYAKRVPLPILEHSLQLTVNIFSQWAGQLSIMKSASEYDKNDHTRRYGSIWLSHGDRSTDAGAELIMAKSSEVLSSVLTDQVKAGKFAQVPSGQAISGVFPKAPVALHDLQNHPGLPGIIIQITTFACGGFTIGAKLAHVLGDAQAIMMFMRAWAAAATESEVVRPIFAPHLVDEAIPGTLGGRENRDEALIKIARVLPFNHFDWWSSVEGCPPWGLSMTKVPEFISENDWEKGESIQWEELDASVPVDHYRLHFKADDVERVYEMCLAGSDSSSGSTSPKISKLDCLNAFVWYLINRARERDFKEHGDETVNFNITLGARERLPQPLHSNFIGSPIFLSRASAVINGTSLPSLRSLALEIRHTISQFTPTSIGALLHDMAHNPCPQRFWGGFLGRRNSLVTSWLRLGVYDINFGSGNPLHVEAIMPAMDGLVHLMEVGPTPEAGKQWYRNGIIVSMYLRRDVGQGLLKDKLLFSYL